MPRSRNIAPNSALAVYDTFGGLRLDVDPEELGPQGAIDLSDIAIGVDNTLRARYGFQRGGGAFTGLSSTIAYIQGDHNGGLVALYGSKASTGVFGSGSPSHTVTTGSTTTGAVVYSTVATTSTIPTPR